MSKPKANSPKLTQDELFPHSRMFPYRLEIYDTIEGLGNIAWFQCETHLTKHIKRYKIASGRVDVMDGAKLLSCDPFNIKKKTTKKTNKSPAKATKAKSTSKNINKKVFSTMETFFSS